jgi:predicted ATPase
LIGSVDISAFKRFSRLHLDLRQLTVLTGLNGSGKSTVIQALLLAHQASREDGETVPLGGVPGLDLGQASDVLNVDADGTEIRVVINDEPRYTWIFDTGPAGADDVPYLGVTERPTSPPAPIGAAGSELMFLSAERLGPRTSHPTSPTRADDAVVGDDGRFVAHALAVGTRREVAPSRRHPAAGSITTLGAHAEAWLSELVGPTQLDASLVPRTSLATLRIRTPGRMGEWMLPTNTGFGVSYSLPVVVAGLLASPGGMLIVDSPEAHLHPAAQSALGFFLAAVAGSGVQVLVETHSDHILNGVRRAVALDGAIAARDVGIVFFGTEPQPAELSMNERGSIDAWPVGFFDQIEADLGALTRRRSRTT